MEQSPHLQRALVLQQQDRHELAEKELRAHLAEAPGDGFAHALLAISLLDLERRDEAERAAKEAIGLMPDLAFVHYALARVLSDRNREDEAALSIAEAIRLEPTDADYHALRAAIEFDRQHWKEALAAAETGLQFDPEHVACNNLRAMALVKLGRKAEAGQTIAGTLSRNPDNALTHANQGWTLLEQGRRKEAMEHFRESLRLDPTNDWARSGLVEAIKSGNPIYAVMLKYFLWMQKLPQGVRWGIVVGGYFGNRMLAELARSHPDWRPWITPVRIAYLIFAVMTWLAYPIFNLLLFIHPYGRHALNDDQRSQAKWVGACLLSAIASLAFWILSNHSFEYFLPSLIFGLLAMPVSAVFSCQKGWPRNVMAAGAWILAAMGIFSMSVLLILNPPDRSPLSEIAVMGAQVFFFGVFLSQWLANWLVQQRPQR